MKPLTAKKIRLLGLLLIFLTGPLCLHALPYLGYAAVLTGLYVAVRARKIAARFGAEEEAPLNQAANPSIKGKFSRQWLTWDSSVHESKGQPLRMQRALTQDITILDISKRGAASIRGTQGKRYRTTFQDCSCPDFGDRGKPCKHMYALAIRYAGFDPLPYIIRTDIKPHPLRGFMNMGIYEVTGKNPETNRSRTRTCRAVDEAGAVRAAMTEHGLIAPFSVKEEAYPEIDEETKAELAAEGVYVPEGAKADDYWAASQRGRDYDDTTVTREQWEYAASRGVTLSALAGETLAREIFQNNHKRWKKRV